MGVGKRCNRGSAPLAQAQRRGHNSVIVFGARGRNCDRVTTLGTLLSPHPDGHNRLATCGLCVCVCVCDDHACPFQSHGEMSEQFERTMAGFLADCLGRLSLYLRRRATGSNVNVLRDGSDGSDGANCEGQHKRKPGNSQRFRARSAHHSGGGAKGSASEWQ